MGWSLRSSRNGVHVVYGQKAERSCGIACIVMVNFKLKKWQLAAAVSAAPAGLLAAAPGTIAALSGAVKSEEEVDAAYAKVTGHPYLGNTDTFATILPLVLNKLDIGRWVGKCIPFDKLADTIIDRTLTPPFITLVRWRSGGGHFVVCDNVVSWGKQVFADFCDPWDAAVRTLPLSRGQDDIVYQAQDQPGLELGQTHKTYSSNKTGDMNGWIVYRAGA